MYSDSKYPKQSVRSERSEMFEIPSATGIDRILKIVDDSVSFLSKFIGNIFSPIQRMKNVSFRPLADYIRKPQSIRY